ncbi:ficolin-2-like [Amphibalanus amphitrite]|uniref:ficolin-2-like n=1 Tax=Amphibalanus amphitrite TaxID=1232801 RepID=UPI001C91ECFE|nr:ficolin-2-like [Amphibalanus amphitrite]
MCRPIAAALLASLCACAAGLESDTAPGAVSLTSVESALWPPAEEVVYRRTETASTCDCRSLCLMDTRCQAAGAQLLGSGRFSCRLASQRKLEAPPQTPPPAEEGAWFERGGSPEISEVCWWEESGEAAGFCGRAPDCAAIRKLGETWSGYRQVQAAGSRVSVICDMDTDGGGWTMIHRRGEGKNTTYDKTEEDFRAGFGYTMGEHWLGLDSIAMLVKREEHHLRVDLWKGDSFTTATYDLKLVSARDNRYDFVKLSGNATDGLAEAGHQGFSFCGLPCTFGGWWGYEEGGEQANLNGVLNESTGKWELLWPGELGLEVIQRAQMLLRPANFVP